jgi:ribosomal protein L11 methyltransferase
MSKTPAAWLRIALEVDPELAEAVAETLSRYISSGIAIESTDIRANSTDQGQAVGPVRVSAFLPVDEQLEETRQRIEQALRYLAMIQPIPAPSYATIQDANWMEAWKAHYQPRRVGRRLLVLPAWMDDEPGDRLPIRIDPGMAFGTGVHPTTQLSLQLLEDHLQPGDRVIDLGCGSGILSIAARRLGAGEVLGVDIDGQAIENAGHNAKLNQVSIQLAQGSLAELRHGAFSLAQADLLVANILGTILMRLLAEDLAGLLAPGGRLLLSGILAEQESEFGQALESAELQIMRRLQMGDWLAFMASAG